MKKHKVFHKQGENCYYHPNKIPSEPYLLSLHNNVVIAANVTFVTHDLIHRVGKYKDIIKNSTKNRMYLGTIEIYDNVFIGANSTIMYNVKIGSNVIIAAGSVVTKDIPGGVVVGGNPAKIIGKFDDVIEKNYSNFLNQPSTKDEKQLEKYYWNKNK